MIDRAEIVRILFAAIDEVNGRLPATKRLAKSEEQIIAGDGAVLESLEYINLVLDLESRVSSRVASEVSIAEELLSDVKAGLPRTLGALADLTTRLCSKM